MNTHILILFCTICGIVIFRRRWVNRTLTTLTILSGITILVKRIRKKRVKRHSLRLGIQRLLNQIWTHHWLWSGSWMHVRIGWSSAHRTCVTRCCRTILMWECLEVHRFRWIHFFAEAKQMECCVRTNFIFHAFYWYLRRRRKKTIQAKTINKTDSISNKLSTCCVVSFVEMYDSKGVNRQNCFPMTFLMNSVFIIVLLRGLC